MQYTDFTMGCAASTQGGPKEQEVPKGPSEEELDAQKKAEEEARESQRQVWNRGSLQ